MAERRPITVVVPVYGDLPSLLRCVDALAETVDTSHDSVLLVNDCGPEVDLIERVLLERVESLPGFRYERNERNLGFVGACNRAALELDKSGNDLLLLNSDTVPLEGWLDELREVLHDDPTHGIVCARSTNATIASLPFRLRDPAASRTVERSSEVSGSLRDRLPRYSYPPVAMGFCFLVRRELIDQYGLFDEVFAPGYGEENDFCLRMGKVGFRSVMAHRALVVHEGARSFLSARRARLRHEHEQILVHRHPDYPDRVRRYLWCDIDPLDAFADILVADGSAPTAVVVVDRATDAPPEFVARVGRRLRVTVIGPSRAQRRLRARYPDAEVAPFGVEDGRVWDTAIVGERASREARFRALHAAPRLLTGFGSHGNDLMPSPVDDEALRAQWEPAADDMRENGIPLPGRPALRSRLRTIAEKRAPFVLDLRQRLTSRRR